MTSVYMMAEDKVEQARGMVSGEIWHDKKLAYLLDIALERLEELAIADIHRRRDRFVARTETVTPFRRRKEKAPLSR
ncbi:MAG TPA: hypothetical protein VNS12_13655 [Pelagibacterium sp.]|uniref:hypothetical protein n=1 Tax=Pelagibacterium sp. TaxID=1967288 RepID=UPI002B65D83C|nr:hypothetical protein [Pelagibacterium sp.]HWJ89108.1 hypothetical protein [Pelagibacterium sp.]